jgi:D-alanine-D-alanine ligase-like ATP-grasp enzyme
MKIVVLAGGTSTERTVSITSGTGITTERTSGDSCGYFLRY